jgi:hypothetical protein
MRVRETDTYEYWLIAYAAINLSGVDGANRR